jgi:hypothetical protein
VTEFFILSSSLSVAPSPVRWASLCAGMLGFPSLPIGANSSIHVKRCVAIILFIMLRAERCLSLFHHIR